MRLTDHAGRPIPLGRQIGRTGGEGSVFEIVGNPQLVGKLYHHAPTPEKVAKLEYLRTLSNPHIQRFAAFPTAVLYENARVRGFTMSLVPGKEIHQLYGPKERFAEFPSAKWDFLVRVAQNCAAAFDEVHKLGIVIGDVNEGNVLVSDDGLVKLIDCDSYQIEAASRVLTCDVGIELWTPPELQGGNFRGLVRSTNHDLFGLAVLIFRLLFMGRHPFAGIPTQQHELMIEKAIAAFMFAFSPKAWPLGIRPPLNCLSIASVSPTVVSLFEAAFLRGSENPRSRPNAARWCDALRDLERNMATCARDPSHRYFRGIAACPWCGISASGGPNFFINIDLTTVIAADGNLGSLLDAIRRQPQVSFKIPDPNNLPLPAATGRAVPAEMFALRSEFITGLVIIAIAISCAYGGFWLVAIIAGLFGWGMLAEGPRGTGLAQERSRRQAAFDSTTTELGTVFTELLGTPARYRADFDGKKSELEATYNRLLRLDQERAAELRKLHQNMEEMQRRDFLDRQLLAHATINGIGTARLGALLSYGIESALDIRYGMSVPGIGPTYEHRLMEWRRKKEGQFRFDPLRGVPKQELNKLDLRMLDIRHSLENQLKQGPSTLAQVGAAAAGRVRQYESRINGLLQAQAQARADLALIPK